MKRRRPPLAVCYHEAGHAVAAVLLRLGLRFVAVWPTQQRRVLRGVVATFDGQCRGTWPQPLKRRCVTWRRRQAVMCLAGHLARNEWRPIALKDDLGAWSDLAQVVWLLRLCYRRGERHRTIVRRQTATLRGPRREARALLRANWSAVKDVALALRREHRLTGAQVRRIVKEAA